MTSKVFVLRPRPGLDRTMKRGRSLGLSMVAMPLSHAEPVEWPAPQGDFDAILLGSANALRHAGPDLSTLAGLPVHAVGEATALAAHARGFVLAEVGTGGLQALLDALPPDRPLNLLRLAGEDRVPLTLPPHVTMETVVTYRVVHHALGRPESAGLAQGGVVLLHSGSAARHFASECARIGVDRAALSLAAIGPRVAASVSDGWKSVASAASPDDTALLSLAADMCH